MEKPGHPLFESAAYRYHAATKHTAARLLGNRRQLDWATQPEPFREYAGAQSSELVRGSFLDELLYHSLAISAWKEIPGTGQRWALRVNPSSGNLHPTEAYLQVAPGGEVAAGLYHYRARDHRLEKRGEGSAFLDPSPRLTVVLTSIFWREAWKYEARAFRYCHHDAGHALASLAAAAAALGWRAVTLTEFPDAEVAARLDLPRGEHPLLIVGLSPREEPAARYVGGPITPLAGVPNRLSSSEITYPEIDAVYSATCHAKLSEPALASPYPAPEIARHDSFRRLARKRRSAVDLDGKARMPRETCLDILRGATRGLGAASPLIELYLYAHRVDGIIPGLYLFERDSGNLRLLRAGDQRATAQRVSCFQEIASHGCFAVSMVANLARAFEMAGDRGYRLAYFEAGDIGQYLYLGATAHRFDATGIGCFQDDEINQYLALPPGREVIYNFTMGRAVEDSRLTTLPAYDFSDRREWMEASAMTMGGAVSEETAALAKRNSATAPKGYRKLGRTGWTTSLVGFGCYRIDDRTVDHETALEKALREGCNLIDTSTNYTDGASERCVGNVIRSLTRNGERKREELIVVSKIGYVQGQNLALAMERERSGNPIPEMVKYTEGCWHCLSPEFITDQLTRSLARLRLEKLDVCLLHNPEYFLSDAKRRGSPAPLSALRDQFYDRIRRAFATLEEEVKRGRISHYGVSSNTFGGRPDAPETTSISRMLEIAIELVGERHHFSVVQLPLNLFESGPVLEKNNGEDSDLTALETAGRAELAVLVNRPLNAMVGNGMVRLADFSAPAPRDGKSRVDHFREVAVLEEEFVAQIAPRIQTEEGSIPANELFRWGTELANPEVERLPMEHWLHLESQMIRPQIQYLCQQLERHFTGEPWEIWRDWKSRYLPALENCLASLREHCGAESQKTSERLAQKLDPFLPESWRTESLSRKAIGVVAHTPHVSCVLNGMREPRYVDDALGVMRLPPFVTDSALYRAFGK